MKVFIFTITVVTNFIYAVGFLLIAMLEVIDNHLGMATLALCISVVTGAMFAVLLNILAQKGVKNDRA